MPPKKTTNKNLSYGLLVFLGDWIRSAAFRKRITDPDTTWGQLAADLASEYQLSEADVGVLISRNRPKLRKRMDVVLAALNLDFPPPWTGAPAPSQGENQRGVGWPGSMIVCLETVTFKKKAPVLTAGKAATLLVEGWNAKARARLEFSHDESGDVVVAPWNVTTDAIGRSKGSTTVTLPSSGDWSLAIKGVDDFRSVLSAAIVVR